MERDRNLSLYPWADEALNSHIGQNLRLVSFYDLDF